MRAVQTEAAIAAHTRVRRSQSFTLQKPASPLPTKARDAVPRLAVPESFRARAQADLAAEEAEARLQYLQLLNRHAGPPAIASARQHRRACSGRPQVSRLPSHTPLGPVVQKSANGSKR